MTKIDINPIKLASAALFNLIIDAINLVIEQVINVLKEIPLKFIFSLIVEFAKILTDALGKLFNQLLRPLGEVSHTTMTQNNKFINV